MIGPLTEDSGAGDATHVATGAAGRGGQVASEVAGSLNPGVNFGTVITNQSITGRKVSKGERGWALFSILPVGKIISSIGNGASRLGRWISRGNIPVRAMAQKLLTPSSIPTLMADMSREGGFIYSKAQITYVKENGIYYVIDGNHRMTAAYKLYLKTGDRTAINSLIEHGIQLNEKIDGRYMFPRH